jgi:BirA family biotin operon repressor/biotin-[acetyl-CoA-carboxylase] ligase
MIVHRLGTVGSTNDEAAALARAGAPHGTVVTALAQTQGRGRQGRAWFSPPGDNLYLSMVLRLGLPPAAVPPVTLAAGVAVVEAVNSLGVTASLEWPNDVVVAGKKIAGILTETSTRGGHTEFVVVGVGLNVNTIDFPGDLEPIATSVRRERGGDPLPLEPIAADLAARLEAWALRFSRGGPAPVARAWKAHAAVLGRRVRVAEGGRVVEGVARDVDDDGALWLDADDGRRLRVISGEVVPTVSS